MIVIQQEAFHALTHALNSQRCEYRFVKIGKLCVVIGGVAKILVISV